METIVEVILPLQSYQDGIKIEKSERLAPGVLTRLHTLTHALRRNPTRRLTLTHDDPNNER